MFRRLILALAFVLIAWSRVEACSPIPEVGTGEQLYSILEASSYKNLFDEDVSIGVISTREVSRKNSKNLNERYRNSDQKLPYTKIAFETIYVIKGHYQKPESDWYPTLNFKQLETELDYTKEVKTFDFWDRLDLTDAKSDDHAVMTSCGESAPVTIAPFATYLHIKKGDESLAFEIIENSNDSFVDDFKRIFSPAIYSKLRRKPVDYFTNMKRAVEIELNSCPPNDFMSKLMERFIYQGEDVPDISQFFRFVDGDMDLFNELYTKDFIAYRTRLKDQKFMCQENERYLVVERPSLPRKRGYRPYFPITQPRHRFLKIETGVISADEVISKIKIISKKGIPVSQIKNWIRAANAP